MSDYEAIVILENLKKRCLFSQRLTIDLAIKTLEERPQGDLISRGALKKKIEEVQYAQEFCIEHQIDYSVSMQMLGMVIDNAPTITPKPIANVTFDDDKLRELVNELKQEIIDGKIVLTNKSDYCPNCGADMRGGF